MYFDSRWWMWICLSELDTREEKQKPKQKPALWLTSHRSAPYMHQQLLPVLLSGSSDVWNTHQIVMDTRPKRWNDLWLKMWLTCRFLCRYNCHFGLKGFCSIHVHLNLDQRLIKAISRTCIFHIIWVAAIMFDVDVGRLVASPDSSGHLSSLTMKLKKCY